MECYCERPDVSRYHLGLFRRDVGLARRVRSALAWAIHLPVSIPAARLLGVRTGTRGMSLSVRFGLCLAILVVLVAPVVGFVLLCLAFGWALLGVYERL